MRFELDSVGICLLIDLDTLSLVTMVIGFRARLAQRSCAMQSTYTLKLTR